MHVKYNLLVTLLLLFTTAIHSQDFDEFEDFDFDSLDEMQMMGVAADPLIFDERGVDNEEFRTFFVEQLFDYSSDVNALLTSQIEFMKSFPLSRNNAFLKAIGVSDRWLNGYGYDNWEEYQGQIKYANYYGDPGDHGQFLYDYLQQYRPISYQRLDDGSEEHFQAMTEFHRKQGFTPFEGLSIAHFVFNIKDSMNRYKTKGASQKMKDICEKIFDDEYIEFGENINALFPEIDSCDPDAVYEAIAVYMSVWNMLESYSNRNELIDDLETNGFKMSIDAFSYKNLIFIWDNFLKFPSTAYLIDCSETGECGYDNVTEYYLEYYFHYWLQTSRVALGNEFIYIEPLKFDRILTDLNSIFLYDDIASEEDIIENLKNYMPNDSMFVSLMVDSTRNSGGKREQRIASFYDNILQDENAIDKLKNPRSYLTQQDLDEEKYYDLATNYFLVKGCYDVRKSYASVYVPYESFQKATRVFNERSNQINIQAGKKEELNKKAIQASSAWFMFDSWNSELNSLCKLSMAAYN
tara:strand:- start:63 stop:1628 length:1566 start_codon:yes stop_codon:yes gene_type:complete